MAELLLTYIVPVYNTEAYLLKCLQSLVNQGLNDDEYEVLVVDDGSTDGSKAIVEAFARDHHQVRLISQANAGVSAARNLAIDNAQGRYVQFVDSDDYLVQDGMVPLIRRAVNENLDVLMYGFRWEDINGKYIKDSKPEDDMATTLVMTGYDYLSQYSLMQYVCWYLVRRDFLNEKNLRFDTSLIACEDGALIAQILLNADAVAYSDAVPYCYVSREDSAMRNNNPEHMKRRIYSQVDAAALISKKIGEFESSSGKQAPASVSGLKNLYLFFSMTAALTNGCVKDVLDRMREAGLYPFPCIGPEINYTSSKWRYIHQLMMHPWLWNMLSKIYCTIKK